MDSMLTCKQIFDIHRIIPVVVLDDVDKAIPLARALSRGGINIMEVTLRTPNALAVIETIANESPDTLVGAGTVISEELYHKAVKHGAKFIVSPGITQNIINVANDYHVPLIAGAITPSEIMRALDAGIEYLKFFPAENYNGRSTLQSLSSVFPQIKFCPTGGITLDNAAEYLAIPNVIGIGVSAVVNQNLIANNQFDKITELAIQFSKLGQDR
jgi:2-dehydro-3-deoxyphosphogluconate aldolase/(4S)-4-hydroxy-2-oxoglutarate aldolase